MNYESYLELEESDMLEYIEEIGQIMEDEYGEYLVNLVAIKEALNDFAGEEFKGAYIEEVKNNYKFLIRHYEIKEVTETYTVTLKELVET
jgi:hypothetical protein